MSTQQTSSPLDTHLSSIARGASYFRTLYLLSLLAIVAAVYPTAPEYWPVFSQELSGAELAIAGLSGAFIVAIKALPMLLFALGFRHLDNLFKAVRGALEDLRTTI